MNRIVVIGGGGHAKVLISNIKKLNHYDIIGYTDLRIQFDILGIKYLGNDDILKELKLQNISKAAIGVGSMNTSDLREQIFKNASSIGFSFPTIISPTAIVNENVEIGDATTVFDGVIINSESIIGKGVILNTNSTIEHDCQIDDFVHIAPSVTLSGNVKIGRYSMIGVGSTIVQGVQITEKVIVGAGSVVIKDILESGTYVGCPARRIS
ncbi:MAG: acetyltransferase [Candidatus Kapabacteria bacterium]|nr:acetyltransferase [Candidatus Kapabacteria bacterium]